MIYINFVSYSFTHLKIVKTNSIATEKGMEKNTVNLKHQLKQLPKRLIILVQDTNN